MIDCVIVGYNEVDFPSYVDTVRAMGATHGAYRDLNLAFITHDGRPYTCMDMVNAANRDETSAPRRRFSNADFLWPVVTYLSTYLMRRGFTVDYVNLFQDEKARLIQQLRAGTVRTVAITTTLYVWIGPILEIVELVRTHAPATTIIVGGPYVHNLARTLAREELDRVLDTIGADVYVVSAEGEAALVRVLDAVKRGDTLAGIDNIVFRDGRTFVHAPETAEANDLAANMVAYERFDPAAHNGMISLRTAKSCPFSCAFCGFPKRAGAYTYLPVEAVERELEAIHRIGTITTLSFIDDTFNVPAKRFKDLLRMMIRRRFGFRWNSYLRADHADEECVSLMRDSGCEGVFLGVESGSDTILQAMNKTSRRHHYMTMIPRLREAGILTHASLIIGFPGETEATVRETRSLIEAAQPDFYRAQLWYCDPTTPIWSRREELGVTGSGFNWSHATATAASAAALVEELFLTLQGSCWLPQYGFEPWSLYYLQRRGLPLAAIKELVTAFNRAVRLKLLDPTMTETPRPLFDSIRRAARLAPAIPQPQETGGHV